MSDGFIVENEKGRCYIFNGNGYEPKKKKKIRSWENAQEHNFYAPREKEANKQKTQAFSSFF